VPLVRSLAACCGVLLATSLGAPLARAQATDRSGVARAELACPSGSRLITGGSFHVGTSIYQDYDANEQPRRAVSLREAFCLDRTEVTVAAYRACVTSGGCQDATPAFGGETMPMTQVSWDEARRYCASMGGRLPTEVEWERAARGDDDRLYPWGDGQPTCARADVWTDAEGACHGYGPSPVGSLAAGTSPYGIVDMAGNVLEWVDDAYVDNAWSVVDDVDPHIADPAAPRHVVRGGSWDYDVVNAPRVSARNGYPTHLRDDSLGFRCAYATVPVVSSTSKQSVRAAISRTVRR
jgi:formylglycine-generating enzyme required for sulfatase activity